ncbi:methylated-DNA--[protein]-cysteine S-methyltransferase [Methanobrevibacter filiformis]|nr:methylated-DNA--[protein]-cysteine S-methyltransferase [Methanobrevibacter filiformis]
MNIKAFCKNNKIIRIFLNFKEEYIIDYNLNQEDIVSCPTIDKLLVDSFNGKYVDFTKYTDLDLLDVTEFEMKVYKETMKIPKGEVRTYKQIGDAIETKGYRAVGNALNKNPLAIIVPCHRVVGSNKKLTGFAGGIEMKKTMLSNEGIKVKGDKAYF